MRSLILLSLLLGQPLYAQDARDIVNRYLDTVSNGNIENWEKIKTIYTEGQSFYGQEEFEQQGNLLKGDKASFSKSYRRLPYDRKHEIYEDSSFSRLLSEFYYSKNRLVMIIGNGPPIIKPAPPMDEFIEDLHPIRLHEVAQKSKSVELLGLKEFPVDGITCYEIKIYSKEKNYLIYINKNTFLLEYWNVRGDADPSVLTKFFNYKRIGELLIPMSDSMMRNGEVYFWHHRHKIIFNSDIDTEIFNYKSK